MDESSPNPTTNRMSRRAFVRASGLAAVLAPLAVPSVLKAENRLSRARKLGIALVGLGYYSTDLLAPALQVTQNCRLAGIVSGASEKAGEWQKKYGIPDRNVYSYETFDRIADNDDIDIVYVVLPNFLHREYTIRAARAGKHVICEKPMAMNAGECEEMIEACEQAGVKLSIGYRMHFEPTTEEIQRLGRQKILGPVEMITAGAGYRESRPDHWKVKRELGGGAMMDMGVYSLQAARYVTGEEPVSVSAQTFTTRPDVFKNCDETTTFQLFFPGGAVANLHTSFTAGMNYLQVTTRDGWFRLDPFSAYSGIKGESSQGPLVYPVINQQAAQMDDVADCILNNEPMRVPGEEGWKDMRVVDAIYRSLQTGTTIKLD